MNKSGSFERIRKFILPPQFDDPEKDRRARLLNFIAWSAIVLIFYLIILRFIQHSNLLDEADLILEALLIVILVLIWFIHRGYIRSASIVLVFSAWLAMAYEAWIGSGIRDTATAGELIIVMICGLLLGWQATAGLSVLSILSLWAMAILETRGVLHVNTDTTFGITRDLTAAFLLAGILMYLVMNSIENYMKRLHVSEERFRKFFHTSPLAIAISTLDEGRFVEANDAFWNLSGLNASQAIGRTPVEFGLWNNTEERDQFVKELKEKHSLQNMDYRFVSQTGEVSDTLAFYELIDLENQPCVLAIFYDITYEKRVQEELSQTEARYHALLNAIPDMIFELDKDGVFINFFKSEEMSSWLPPEQFVGKNIRDVMPDFISSPTLFGIERTLLTNQTYAFEYQLSGTDGLHNYESRLIASGDNSVLAMVRDITARKWGETEREALINELESKNAELERFTYTVSHDLKSPLITIKGFLGFLREDANKGDRVRLAKDVERISDASDKMQILLNDLLELSRIGRLTNPSEDIAFQSLVNEAIDLVQGRIQARGIQMDIQPNLPHVYGDRPRLMEVLQNLIDNAAKFMGNQAEPHIEIGWHDYADNGKPIFFVRDNGIGIAPEFHERVFGLFNKLDSQAEGTGIGLSIVKRIIEVHGGSIWIESEAGKGATFFFTLPQKPKS
ncbi:MAG: ATP-binding protein [Anaerolineales bacterium]